MSKDIFLKVSKKTHKILVPKESFDVFPKLVAIYELSDVEWKQFFPDFDCFITYIEFLLKTEREPLVKIMIEEMLADDLDFFNTDFTDEEISLIEDFDVSNYVEAIKNNFVDFTENPNDNDM